MAKQTNEDLFSASTMTFGEHLEELRVSLSRALIGLVIGFLLGLLIANQVVQWIQRPLKSALTKHYSESAKLELQKLYPEEGQIPPTFEEFVADQGLIYEEVLVEEGELKRWTIQSLKEILEKDPQDGHRELLNTLETATADLALDEDGNLPPPDPNMIKTRLWRPAKARLTTLSPHESFIIWLKAGFVSGLIVASPYIFYQIWVFVAAGLFPHEKRFIYIFLPFSILLFVAGAALAFFFVFGPVLNFLFSFSRAMNIDPDLRISEVISFVLFLPLGFGLAFQLPLVMLFLNRIGIFSVEAYLSKWRIAILVIFVISMLLTPADPISMMLMAVPLTGLYFLGVALCQWMPRSRNPFNEDEAYDPS
jgi:sec-independent protein translocase protein TatC